MRKILACLLLIIAAGPLSAESPVYSNDLKRLLEETRVTITLPGMFEPGEADRREGQAYSLAYRADENTELRLLIVPLSFFKHSSDFSLNEITRSWEYMTYLNVGGFEIENDKVAPHAKVLFVDKFPDMAVRNDYGADFGDLVLIGNLNSRFSVGFKDALMAFFYNESLGLVQVMILHNDGNTFPERSDFAKLLGCFRFENGRDWIKPDRIEERGRDL